MKRRLILAAGTAAILTLAYVGYRTAPGAEGQKTEPTGAVTPAGMLSDSQLRHMGIKTAAASNAEAMPVGTVPAQVSLPPEARVAVTSPFAGVVTQVLVIPGQQVARGQALAIVQAAEPVQFGAELARMQADLPVLRANAARLGQLAKEGIIAPARADEALAALQRGAASVAEQQRLLAMAGAASNGTVTLRAPIAGRLASVTVEAGAPVGNAAAPFIVENTAALRLDLQLPERLAGKVRPGMAVEVPMEAGADGAKMIHGRILSVAASLDPQTRSLAARAALDAGAVLTPGKGVMAIIRGAEGAGSAGVSVASAAVVRIEADDCVFVRQGSRFVRRPVALAGEAGGRTYIASGLKAGEIVAISGVAELKSLMAGQ